MIPNDPHVGLHSVWSIFHFKVCKILQFLEILCRHQKILQHEGSKAIHQLQKAQIRESIDKIQRKIKPVTEQIKGPMYVI